MRRIALFVCVLALGGCGMAKKERPLQGYAEADLLYLSPREPGFVQTLAVKEGDEVKAGALIFRLDVDRSPAVGAVVLPAGGHRRGSCSTTPAAM